MGSKGFVIVSANRSKANRCFCCGLPSLSKPCFTECRLILFETLGDVYSYTILRLLVEKSSVLIERCKSSRCVCLSENYHQLIGAYCIQRGCSKMTKLFQQAEKHTSKPDATWPVDGGLSMYEWWTGGTLFFSRCFGPANANENDRGRRLCLSKISRPCSLTSLFYQMFHFKPQQCVLQVAPTFYWGESPCLNAREWCHGVPSARRCLGVIHWSYLKNLRDRECCRVQALQLCEK